MNPALAPRFARWLAYPGLWVLLSSVFASQLYLAGYVRPWPRAFAAEAVYWLAWWILVPAVFWWCRRLRNTRWSVRAPALLLGGLASLLLAPLIAQVLRLRAALSCTCAWVSASRRSRHSRRPGCPRRCAAPASTCRCTPVSCSPGTRAVTTARRAIARCMPSSSKACCTSRNSTHCAASSIRISCSTHCIRWPSWCTRIRSSPSS